MKEKIILGCCSIAICTAIYVVLQGRKVFFLTMEKISKTMDDIKDSTERMQNKVGRIEDKLGIGGSNVGKREGS